MAPGGQRNRRSLPAPAVMESTTSVSPNERSGCTPRAEVPTYAEYDARRRGCVDETVRVSRVLSPPSSEVNARESSNAQLASQRRKPVSRPGTSGFCSYLIVESAARIATIASKRGPAYFRIRLPLVATVCARECRTGHGKSIG